MATIGHPLSDVTNLIGPFITTASPKALKIGRGNQAFIPGAVPSLPTKEKLLEWYAEVAGWDPRPELVWGEAFNTYRGAVIMQGIAARYALRQASSLKAMEYGSQMKPFAEIGWDLVQEAKKQHKKVTEKAKL